MSIQRDLNIGKVAENRMCKMINEAGYETEFSDKANRVLWDIAVIAFHEDKEKKVTIEVKNDIYALKSGNIAVEFYNPKAGKNSGLSATDADLWVFMVGEELWIANTKALKDFVEKTKPHRIISSGGDDNASLYLYKKDHILPTVFIQIDGMPKKKLIETLRELL